MAKKPSFDSLPMKHQLVGGLLTLVVAAIAEVFVKKAYMNIVSTDQDDEPEEE
jgi:hypothetical protein